MTKPIDLDLTVYQGSTFQLHLLHACGSSKQIDSITNAAPAAVKTVKPHGYSTGQSLVVVDGKGITLLNDNVYSITVTDSLNFTLDGTDTSAEPPYLEGGYVAVPNDLTGYTALMHIRSRASSDTLILELSTANGRISLGGPNGIIELEISAAITANLEKGSYVYDLELISPGSIVSRLIQGSVEVDPETTK